MIVTGIEENLPLTTELYQNYPNPFNPVTVIKYLLAEEADVTLAVYDIAGREIIKLVDKKKARGYHEAKFKADGLTSGMYFYRLSVNDKVVASRKMMILK